MYTKPYLHLYIIIIYYFFQLSRKFVLLLYINYNVFFVSFVANGHDAYKDMVSSYIRATHEWYYFVVLLCFA